MCCLLTSLLWCVYMNICIHTCTHDPISHQLWSCRLNPHTSSHLLLFKHTAQGLMHSSWPLYPSLNTSPLGSRLHSSSSCCSSSCCSCASRSSLPSKSRSTPHRATTEPPWPFLLLSISCPAARLGLSAHTPTQNTNVQWVSVPTAGSGVLTSEAQWKRRELMVRGTPSSWLQMALMIIIQHFGSNTSIATCVYIQYMHAVNIHIIHLFNVCICVTSRMYSGACLRNSKHSTIQTIQNIELSAFYLFSIKVPSAGKIM